LVRVIALHEDSPADTIREMFRELCQDEAPEIADRTIRYYTERKMKCPFPPV
jgi:hypothetical protein